MSDYVCNEIIALILQKRLAYNAEGVWHWSSMERSNMAATSLEEIQSLLAEHRATLVREFGVTRIGVFGSWARNEATESSDIDILVEFGKAPGFFKFLELEEQLTQWLGHPVDLVTRGALKPRMGRHILEEVIMV